MEFGGIKVLMISTDRNILVPLSAVSKRMKEYGKLVDELHIILMSDKKHGLKQTNLEKNIFVYPTNAPYKFFRIGAAARLGKKIVFENKFVRGKAVITAQDPFECGLAGLKVKRKWRLPLEVQLHTDPFSPYFKGFLNAIRKRISKKVLRQADAIRVVNQAVGKNISDKYRLDSKIISALPIFVDQEKVTEGQITFDLHARYGWQFVLLTVSRLTKEKNISLAIDTIALLRTRYPDIGLVIVGSGPEEESLKKKVKDLGLERAVAFAGWQSDLASYYRTANVFLQTSFFEGYGLSLVEAGLAGLPVVSTPVGLAMELEDGKDLYICPQNDAGYFANAIADLVENNQKRENLRLNLKKALESKLLKKEEYLLRMKNGWESVAAKVK